MSMNDHIAVLDKAGNILIVNRSWLDFARENNVSSLELVGEGINYLEACRSASEDSDKTSQRALRGIQAVLDGSQKKFELEYPCHSPSEQRWFIMRVIPFKGEKGGVIVVHRDVTEKKLAEEKARKQYIAYTINKKNFCGIVVRQVGLWVYLDINKSDLKDPENVTEDCSKIGHWATGDTRFDIKGVEDIDYAILLIKQVYEKF